MESNRLTSHLILHQISRVTSEWVGLSRQFVEGAARHRKVDGDAGQPKTMDEFKQIAQKIHVTAEASLTRSELACAGAGLIEREFYIRQNILKEMGKLQEFHNQMVYAKDHKNASVLKEIAKKLGVPNPETQAELTLIINKIIIERMIILRQQLSLLAMDKERLLEIMEHEYKLEKDKKIKIDHELHARIEKQKVDYEREQLLAAENRARQDFLAKQLQEIKQLEERVDYLSNEIKRLEAENAQIRADISKTLKTTSNDILTGNIVPDDSSIDKYKLHFHFQDLIIRFDAGHVIVDTLADHLHSVINKAGKNEQPPKKEDAQSAFDGIYKKLVDKVALHKLNDAQIFADKLEKADKDLKLKIKKDILPEIYESKAAQIPLSQTVVESPVAHPEPLTRNQQRVIDTIRGNLAEIDACAQLVCADPTKPLIEQPKFTRPEVEQKQAQREDKESITEVRPTETKEQKPAATLSTTEEDKSPAPAATEEIKPDSNTPSPVASSAESEEKNDMQDKIDIEKEKGNDMHKEGISARDDLFEDEEEPQLPRMGR